MSTIDSYMKQAAKKYPNSKEVTEQLEEIRDTLHIKTEEYQAQGLGYEEAARAAIDSIGDISALMRSVAGESRTVYANKLFMHLSIIVMSALSLELTANFLLLVLPYHTSVYPSNAFVDNLILIAYQISIIDLGGGLLQLFWLVLFPLLVVVWIWPLVSIVKYIIKPKKTGSLQIHSKQQIKIAWIGFLVLSVILFILNMQAYVHLPVETKFWFVWPVIFLSNWPLAVCNYSRFLRSGRYNA
jgi:hypothetical protein